jgi:acetoacetyl-CoA synthetase
MHDRLIRWSRPRPSHPQFSSLVPLQPAGTGRPLFLVPGVYGMVAELRTLAETFGCGRPVYGLQPLGLDPGQTPHDRIEAIAAHYLGEIRRIQPRGPYAVIGFSFGGQVAFEMAQQIRAGGEVIELLALLDAPLPRHYLPWSAVAKFRVRRAVQGARLLATRRNGQGLPRPWSALRDWRATRRERHMVGQAMAAALPPLPPHRREVCDAHLRAVHAYEPRRYGSPVLFLQAATHSPHWADPVPAWRRWCPRLVLHRVAGDHHSILQAPDVAAVAAHIERWLQSRAAPAKKNAAESRAMR